MSYKIVWFKRDLRVHDHAPLVNAAQRGSILCLYVIEPSLWQQPDYALQHYRFLQESLEDLSAQLRRCGAELQVAVGEVIEALARLHAAAPDRVHSHEETGNGHTFTRDRDVARWCGQRGVTWQEWAQHGVVRRFTRNVWSARWQAHMDAPCLPAPDADSLASRGLPWPSAPLPDPGQFGPDK